MRSWRSQSRHQHRCGAMWANTEGPEGPVTEACRKGGQSARREPATRAPVGMVCAIEMMRIVNGDDVCWRGGVRWRDGAHQWG